MIVMKKEPVLEIFHRLCVHSLIGKYTDNCYGRREVRDTELAHARG
jgi:hypothetical protein